VAVTIGLGSALLPAYHAARLNVAEALRFVG
jgi:ABC-type antimicrobial peptide transport system permease subunit